MKIQYYGTGAGGGIPEIFCSCRVCMQARAERGHNIRTRSQAVIDDRLSIEFPVDTFCHTAFGGLDMRRISHVLITHAHHDHFLLDDVISRPQGVAEPIRFYASEKSGAALRQKLNATEELYRTGKRIRTSEYQVLLENLEMYVPKMILDYMVIPLRARHAEAVDAMIFWIRSDDVNILWGHDTGLLPEEVIAYLKEAGVVFDMISLDCTLKRGEQITKSHMDLEWCRETVERLRANHNANENTKVVLSHIGHLVERTHEELVSEAAEYGFQVAYDGMVIEI